MRTRPLEIIKRDLRLEIAYKSRTEKRQPIYVTVNLLAACNRVKSEDHPLETLVTLLAICRQKMEEVQ